MAEFIDRCKAVNLQEGSLFSWLERVENLTAENAALKEQVKVLRDRCANLLDLKDAAHVVIKEKEETIAQQAEAIRMKDEALFTACSTFTEYAQIHSAKQPADTRKAEFNADRATQMKTALAIQPSHEIPQVRDERVAEAIIKQE